MSRFIILKKNFFLFYFFHSFIQKNFLYSIILLFNNSIYLFIYLSIIYLFIFCYTSSHLN